MKPLPILAACLLLACAAPRTDLARGDELAERLASMHAAAHADLHPPEPLAPAPAVVNEARAAVESWHAMKDHARVRFEARPPEHEVGDGLERLRAACVALVAAWKKPERAAECVAKEEG